jgi:hypothetical protein
MSRFRAVTSATYGRAPSRRVLSGLAILLGASSLALLTGCGATGGLNLGSGSHSGTEVAGLKGRMFGGQAPVTGATVTLYAASTSGYASPATEIPGATTTTDSSGNFTIPAHTCPAAPGDQLFLLAVGGNPGNSGGTVNPNLVEMAALGSCNSSTYPSFVWMDEVSTVVSAYSLSQFLTYSSTIDTAPASSPSPGAVPNIGIYTSGSSCNAAGGWKSTGPNSCNYIGLENAMNNVVNLMCYANGNPPPDSIPYSYYIGGTCATGAGDTSEGHTGYAPSSRINTLASILATCVNSTGGTHGGAASNCNTLFTDLVAPNGTYPTDTLQAILNLAQNPFLAGSANDPITGVAASFFGLLPASPVFNTPAVMTSGPNDWTLAMGFTAGGFINYTQQADLGTYGPTYSTGMAIDSQGNIWATSVGASKETASTSATSGPGGVVGLSNNGANISNNSVSGTWGGYQDSGNVSRPRSGPAVDLNDDIWVGNFGSSTANATLASINSAGGTVLAPVTVVTDGYVQGLALDANGNIWVTGVTGSTGALNEYSLAGVQNTGISTFTYSDFPSFNNVAVDQNGNVWLTQADGDTQITASTGTEAELYSGSGNYGQLAVDSAGDVFGCNTGYIYEDEPPSTYVQLQTGGCYAGTLYAPIALDGRGNLWSGVVSGAETGVIGDLQEVNSISGSVLSPPTYGYQGILGAGGTSDGEASVVLLTDGPESTYNISGTAVDQSGNVWVLNGYDKSVSTNQFVEFVGLGAPTVQPIARALKYGAFNALP